MKNTIKLTATLSLVTLIATACAPNAANYTNKVASGQPKVYSYHASTGTAVASGKVPVTHSHGGKVHTHILPPSGIIHTHAVGAHQASYTTTNRNYSNPVNTYRPTASVYRPVASTNTPRPATSYRPSPAYNYNRPPYAAPRANNYSYSVSNNAPTQQQRAQAAAARARAEAAQAIARTKAQAAARAQTNANVANTVTTAPQSTASSNYYYDYTPANTSNTTDTVATVAPATRNYSYYTYGGTNNTTTSTPSDYYSYSQPKASSSYYENTSANSASTPKASASTSSYYDYSAGNSASTTSSSPIESSTRNSYYDYPSSTKTANTSNASGASQYTVQQGDTVFQVMRNTGAYWKDIIRLNNLQEPTYTIVPGQTLLLK